MSKESNNVCRYLRSALFSVPVVLRVFLPDVLLFENTASAEVSTQARQGCPQVSAVSANTTERRSGVDGVECFESYVESRGYLWLDLAVPGVSTVEPRLDFLGQTCEAPRIAGDAYGYLERTADSMLLEIRAPGSYVFCAAAQDPAQPLGELKLSSGFVDEARLAIKAGDPEEDEPPPDPDPRAGDPEEEPPPDPKAGDPEEDEPPPDPTVKTIRAARIREPICQLGTLDDHGDTPFCSTPLAAAESVHGELGNAWGDDHDYFAFSVTALRTVRFETTGDTDTFGGLYDHHGYRIAMDDDGGSGVNFRLVKTLSPGLYFVRVEGSHQAQGPYRLIAGTWR